MEKQSSYQFGLQVTLKTLDSEVQEEEISLSKGSLLKMPGKEVIHKALRVMQLI